jgi:hypothetical protein
MTSSDCASINGFSDFVTFSDSDHTILDACEANLQGTPGGQERFMQWMFGLLVSFVHEYFPCILL